MRAAWERQEVRSLRQGYWVPLGSCEMPRSRRRPTHCIFFLQGWGDVDHF